MLDGLIDGLEDTAGSLRKLNEILDLEDSSHICALSFQLESYQKLIKMIFDLLGNELFSYGAMKFSKEQNKKQESQCQI
jgi:hypothetical protein